MAIRPSEELWDWRQVSGSCGGETPVSHSTISRWSKCGILPPPIALGPATIRWSASEVRAALKRMRQTTKGWQKKYGKVVLGKDWDKTPPTVRAEQAVNEPAAKRPRGRKAKPKLVAARPVPDPQRKPIIWKQPSTE
jgi:predicted DNA-binding transcriptional regulator AlpA